MNEPNCPVSRGVPLYLAWLLLLSGAGLLALSDALPYRLTFLTPGRAHSAFVAVEIFLAVFLWPLAVPRLAPDLKALGLHLVVLAGLALPLALCAANLSGAGLLEVLRGQVLVAAYIALIGVLLARGPGSLPWVLLGAFLLSAAFPLGAYLSAEACALLSPFRAAADPGSGLALAHTLVAAGLAGGLAALPRAK